MHTRAYCARVQTHTECESVHPLPASSTLHLPVLQILTLFHRHPPVRSSSKEQLHGNILQEWNSVFQLSWQKHFPEALFMPPASWRGPFTFTRGSVAPRSGGNPWPRAACLLQDVLCLWPRSKPGCYYGPDISLARGAVCFHTVSGRHEMTWGRFPICTVPTTWERKQLLWCHVVCLISIKCSISTAPQCRQQSHRQRLGYISPTFFTFMRTYFSKHVNSFLNNWPDHVLFHCFFLFISKKNLNVRTYVCCPINDFSVRGAQCICYYCIYYIYTFNAL